jgi:hypothetical protein
MSSQLPDVITPITALELAVALNTAWHKLFDALPSRDTILILVAQSAHENWKWKPVHCFNIGNIRSFDGDDRDYTFFRCRETKRNGETVWRDPPHPRTRHRAYPTLVAAAVDYLAFLQADKRYAAAWDPLVEGKPRAFVAAFKAGADDEGPYARELGKLFGEFNLELPIPLPELVVDDAELGGDVARPERPPILETPPPPPIVLEDEPGDLEPDVHDTEPAPPPVDDE